VFKRLLVLLSLVAGGVGFWSMLQVRAKDAACQIYAGDHPGAQVGAVCARVVPTYLAGSALAGVGCVVLVFTLFAIVRRARAQRWQQRMPTLPSTSPRVIGRTPTAPRTAGALPRMHREVVKV
jgi:hypothetical protein